MFTTNQEPGSTGFERMIGSLLLVGIPVMFVGTSRAVLARFLVFVGLGLLVLFLKPFDWTWSNLSSPARCFLGFWLLVVASSTLVGILLTGDYLYFLSKGWVGLLWILESWRVWGIGVLLVFGANFSAPSPTVTVRCLAHVFFVVSVVLILVFGYAEYLLSYGWVTGEPFRVFGARSTNSAKTLNLYLPFLLAGIVRPPIRTYGLRFLYFVLFVLGTLGLALTGSRAGLVAFTVVLALMIFIFLFQLESNTYRGILVLSVLLPLLIYGTFLPDTATQRLSSKIEQTLSTPVTETYRFRRIWPLGLRLVANRPLLGYGAGTYYRQAESLDSQNRSNLAKVHPHNVFLQVAYQGGVIGLLVFLLFVVRLIQATFNLLSRRAKAPYELAALLSLCALILFHGLFEAVNWGHVCLLLAMNELGRYERSPDRKRGC